MLITYFNCVAFMNTKKFRRAFGISYLVKGLHFQMHNIRIRFLALHQSEMILYPFRVMQVPAYGRGV